MATAAAPEAPEAAHVPLQRKENARLEAGGRYALVSDYVVETIAGYPVQIAQRQDGAWFAKTVDYRLASRRRQWMSGGGDQPGDRAELVARIERSLVETPPRLEPVAAGAEAGPPAASAPTLPALVADRIPEGLEAVVQEPPKRTNGAAGGPSWRAVSVDPADFPLAAALDALEASVAPALAALEAAGKGDAAALVRAEVATTPVEAELLALWRRVHRGD